MDGLWEIIEDKQANRLQVVMPFQTKEGTKNRIIYTGKKPLNVDIATFVIEHNNEIIKRAFEIAQLKSEIITCKFVE